MKEKEFIVPKELAERMNDNGDMEWEWVDIDEIIDDMEDDFMERILASFFNPDVAIEEAMKKEYSDIK